MKKYKSKLSVEDRSLGSRDDAFYISETIFKKEGEVIGKWLGMTPKEIKRKNDLLKTVKELESKAHMTHSTMQRNKRIINSFPDPYFDTSIAKIKKVKKRFPH